MKKKVLVGLLAAATAFSLASCDEEVSITELSISGYETEFTVGDAFDDGDLVVKAKYSDGTEADVTSQATVTQSADMSKPGSYAVIVSFDGKVQAYQINVEAKPAPENVSTIKEIIVNADDAKKAFSIGDTFSADGILVNAVYENTLMDNTIKAITDYTVKVTNEAGEEVTALDTAGTYTVTVTANELADSYEITVGKIAYDTVEEAVDVVFDNVDKVSSGNAMVSSDGTIYIYDYAFGEGYTYQKQDIIASEYESVYEVYYYLLDEETVFGIDVEEGELSPTYYPVLNNMYGPDFSTVTSYDYDTYGLEAVISNLYAMAKVETTTNLVEKVNYCPVCGEVESYEFSFTTDEYYNWTRNVEFGYNEDNVLAWVNVEMSGYYATDAEGEDIVRMFKSFSATQESGEKAVSPYNLDELFVTSFDVTDSEGAQLTEEKITITSGDLASFKINNIAPATANLNVDPIQIEVLDADGFDPLFYTEFDKESGIAKIEGSKAGTYTVNIKTANVTKTITLVVEPAELTEFNAGVYNGYYYSETDAVSCDTNETIDFSSIVNDGADGSFTAQLSEENDAVSLEYDEYSNCYYFSATEAGTYTVVLTSSVNSEMTASIVFTVTQAKLPQEILTGTYVYENFMYGTTTYVFDTPTVDSETGNITGSFTVECDGEGYVDAQSATYTYTYYPAIPYFEATKTSSEDCWFTADFYGNKLYCVYNNIEKGELTPYVEEDEETIEAATSGEVSYTVTNANSYEYDTENPYTIVAGATGTYAFTVPATIGFYSVAGWDAFAEAEVDFNNNTAGTTVEFDLEEGEEFAFYLGGTTAGEYTVTWAIKEGTATSGEVSYTVTNANSYEYDTENPYTITAPEAGTYVFTVPATIGLYSVDGWDAFAEAEVDFNNNTAGTTVEFDLEEGEEFSFYLGGTTAGEYTVTWAIKEEIATSGEITFAVSMLNFGQFDYYNPYTITAPEAGTYVFTVPATMGFYSVAGYDAYEEAEIDFNLTADGGTLEFDLEEGEEFAFYLGGTTVGEYTVTWELVTE